MSNSALDWAWSREGLNPVQQLVLVALADHANEKQAMTCRPGMKRLIRRTKLSERSIRSAIAFFVERGLIRKAGGVNGTAAKYQVLVPDLSQLQLPGMEPLTPAPPARVVRVKRQPKTRQPLQDVPPTPAPRADITIRTQVSVANATAQSAPPEPPEPPLTDKEAVFTEGVETVIRLIAEQPDPARKFVGGMLARTGNNYARVLTILRQCEAECVIDPRGWIMSKLGGGNVVRGEFGQAVRRQNPREANMHNLAAVLGMPQPGNEDEFTGKTVEGAAL